MNKEAFKKTGDELKDYMEKFRRRGSFVESKKGKGSKYSRTRTKNQSKKEIEEKD